VAIYPDHASDENNFIKNADAAMYLAKNSGRDNVQLFKPSVT
jgi:GGDEF domain-containing protein